MAHGPQTEAIVRAAMPRCPNMKVEVVTVRYDVPDLMHKMAELDRRCISTDCIVYSVIPLAEWQIPHAEKHVVKLPQT